MNNTLSDSEIDEILKSFKLKYNGIFEKDCLPEKLENGFFIINLQSSTDGHGTHWTALLVINPCYAIYFDSFGEVPPKDVEVKLKYYLHNKKDIQNINSSSCGFYCIGFIKFMSKFPNNPKQAFDTFIAMFCNDTQRNEEILSKILYL